MGGGAKEENTKTQFIIMTKAIYESPLTEVLEMGTINTFLASGEKVSIVTGYDWDEDE